MERFPRQSGILLHPTSLPGGHGIGDFGAAARDFLGFLERAGQSLWQMLPLGPTGYGDSPYQTFSAFAGNPLLISLEDLTEDGLLEESALKGIAFPEGRCAYEAAAAFKLPLLDRAAEQPLHSRFDIFCEQNRSWLDDFARFMALKRLYNGIPWHEWDPPHRDRHPGALARLDRDEARVIRSIKFSQWIFFEQFHRLRGAAHERGISLMGDIPIYVAADSSDIWSARELWLLDEDGTPALQAGVPPDYFSATGQLWGNPIYRWERHREQGYAWWIERFRASFAMFDIVRVDHFRGFQAFWQVPGKDSTAEHGEWVDGPGAALFEAVEAALGPLRIVAENLGVITTQVEEIRRRFGYPGMAVLQFAFGDDPQAHSFRPHNYPREIAAYPGTHDNDTTLGWWHSTAGTDSTRTAEDIRAERRFCLDYLGIDSGIDIHWAFIRALLASVASTVVIPAQDLLGLGSEARMNTPSTLGQNWLWRLRPGQLSSIVSSRLRRLVDLYDRLPPA
jgi:4-alpha-glucanotransferase